MKYSLKYEKGKHFVFETKTEIYFGPFESKKKARDQMRFMESGGAFNGHTPSFMLNGDYR